MNRSNAGWVPRLLWLARLLLGFTLYALVRALEALLGGPRRATAVFAVALAALALWLTAALPDCGRPVRVATFNVREFGAAQTDMDRLTAIVRGLGADVLAVQEVQDPRGLEALAARASGGGRSYRAVHSACGGRLSMRLGFVYDAGRVALEETREYPELDPGGEGRCTEGDRPGFLGVFRAGRRAVHLLALHLKAGGDAEALARRRAQWARAFRIAADLRAGGAGEVLLLGDVNSTDYLRNEQGERDFLEGSARAAGMDVSTGGLPCSEYWEPGPGVFEPSLLDHVVASRGAVRAGSARVHGFCGELSCAAVRGEAPADYLRVSDHCPVTVDLAP